MSLECEVLDVECGSDADTHGRNANFSDARIEDIGAVRRRMHPLIVNFIGGRGDGDVFRKDREGRSFTAGALAQVWLAWELVRQRVMVHHHSAVFTSGGGETAIPVQRGEPRKNSRFVELLEQQFFRGGLRGFFRSRGGGTMRSTVILSLLQCVRRPVLSYADGGTEPGERGER